MIDDSIVRGTTSDRDCENVKRCRSNGSSYARQLSAIFISVLFWNRCSGTGEQLIAYNRTVEDIRQVIGADSLAYLKLERLSDMVGGLPYCSGCFTGKYPLDPPTEDIRGDYDK